MDIVGEDNVCKYFGLAVSPLIDLMKEQREKMKRVNVNVIVLFKENNSDKDRLIKVANYISGFLPIYTYSYLATRHYLFSFPKT